MCATNGSCLAKTQQLFERLSKNLASRKTKYCTEAASGTEHMRFKCAEKKQSKNSALNLQKYNYGTLRFLTCRQQNRSHEIIPEQFQVYNILSMKP